jgi:hypothetical protein
LVPASRFSNDFLKRRIFQNALDQAAGHPIGPLR